MERDISSLFTNVFSFSPLHLHFLILLPFSLSISSFSLSLSPFLHFLSLSISAFYLHFLIHLPFSLSIRIIIRLRRNMLLFVATIFSVCWQTHFTAFVASIAKIHIYAFRENILDQNSFRKILPNCDSLQYSNNTQQYTVHPQCTCDSVTKDFLKCFLVRKILKK